MPSGIRVLDGSGNTVMDMTTPVGTYLGQMTLPFTDGYLEHPQFANGQPFFALIKVEGGGGNKKTRQPSMSVTNGPPKRINWTWPAGLSPNMTCIMFYGVY